MVFRINLVIAVAALTLLFGNPVRKTCDDGAFSIVMVHAFSTNAPGKRKAGAAACTEHPCHTGDKNKTGGDDDAALPVPPNCHLHPAASIVRLSATERGLRVGENATVPPDAVFLRVPLSELITPRMGREDTPAGRAACEEAAADGGTVDWHTSIALWLCHAKDQRERKKGGAPAPSAPRSTALTGAQEWYLDALPWRDLDHLPLLWSDADLAELDGSPLLAELCAKRDQWGVLHAALAELHPPFAAATSRDAFVRAKCLVGSRTFRLDADDVDGVAMIPLASMFNHRAAHLPGTCTWAIEHGRSPGVDSDDDVDVDVDDDDAAFVVRTRDAVRGGGEAFVSYGAYSNGHYLYRYGFCIEEDGDGDVSTEPGGPVEVLPEVAQLWINLPGASASAAGDDGGATADPEWFAVPVGDADSVVDVLATLRHSAAAAAGEGGTAPQPRQERDCRAPWHFENERAAVASLVAALEAALSLYPTTLAEDRELLRRGAPTVPRGSNRRNAILVRSGEKRVLLRWLGVFAAAREYLDEATDGDGASWQHYVKVLDSALPTED